MKLSQMTNDQACEAMIRLAEPCSNLLKDETVMPLLDSLKNGSEGESVAQMFGRILPKFVSFAMKDHKADLYEIVGVLSETPTAKVGKMPFVQTVKVLKESIDEDFIDFFKSSGDATSNPGTN